MLISKFQILYKSTFTLSNHYIEIEGIIFDIYFVKQLSEYLFQNSISFLPLPTGTSG